MATTASIVSALQRLRFSLSTSEIPDTGEPSPFRPPQWGQGASFTMTATDPATNKQTAYVFDAILRAEHEQGSVVTMNPIQTGAPITDHQYTLPARLTIEILTSDAMQSFTLGQWADNPSKSVSVYQTLVSLQKKRGTVQVATRLRTYGRMLISDIRAEDTKETTYGLKAIVTFIELRTAVVGSDDTASTLQSSALPQSTGSTVAGQTQPQSVPPSIFTQFNIQSLTPAVSGELTTLPSVPAAGAWSSLNVNNIPKTFGL